MGPLDPNDTENTAFDAIKSGSEEEGYVYNFQDGDEIISSSTSDRFIIGSNVNTDLTITGDISVRGTASADETQQLNGLYVWVGTSEESYWTLHTDDISIVLEITGTPNRDRVNVTANGIFNQWGETQTGKIDIDVTAKGENAYGETAQGLITKNGGKIAIDGGSIKVVAQNTGYATQAFGISAEGHNKRSDTISSNGALEIYAEATSTSNDAGSFAAAYGIKSSNNRNGNGLSNVVSLDKTSVIARAEATYGTAEAIGVYGGALSQTTVGEGSIEVTASSQNGQGKAYGLYADNGAEKIVKGSGDITVKGSALAAGICALSGEVSYGGGNISASMTSEDIEPNAEGIYTSTDAQVTLIGNTNVEAASALVGSGTVVVEKTVSAGFDGTFNQFDGDLTVRGVSGLGMSVDEAIGYTTEDDAAALVLFAGSTLDGHYQVGTEAQSEGSSSTGSSLDLLADGTLVIVANAEYDGKSPLVTVDSASAEEGSVLRLVNSARVKDGTSVFGLADGATLPQGYVFDTDNLLTEVVDNKVRKKSVESVFGGSVLLPNVIEEALAGETGEGADRILELTSDALSPSASGKALNRIALMGAAGGAQIAASNAVVMVDESLMRHGSKLVTHGHEIGRADLWVDLNGSFSRAHDFSAGSTNFGYKSDLAGGTFGADYVFANGLAAGAALSFGTGSVRGQDNAAGTKNDVDFWGVSVYGVWDAGVVNVIGTLGWLQTKNEISQSGFTGEPDVSALTLSARVEKSFDLGVGYAMTPHAGVRWTRLDADDFTAGGFRYENEKVDLLSFPIGVAFSKAFATAGGAPWKSFLDLEIAPTAGDRKSNNTVGLVGSAVEDAFDARITSSVVYSARVGLSGRIGKSHDVGLYYGVSAGNGEFVAQHLKASYRYAF